MIYKNIIPTSNKLEEVHVNLWSPYYLALTFNNTYSVILMYKNQQKI